MSIRRFVMATAATAVALLLGGISPVQAQEAVVISGRVTDAAGNPLAGANIGIPAVGVGANTQEDGRYTLTVPERLARGQTVPLTVRRIGFGPVTRQVTLAGGSQTQDFSLNQDPFRLDAVVVTGVAEATEQRKLTFSVGQVTAEQIELVPASSPIGALSGKVSGVRVQQGNGAPGQNPVVRLRASTVLQGQAPTGGGGGGTSYSNAPLLIVDGVITQGSLADIDANDIESIEVLKGAAAANTYGSDAANGVIQILTKRGRNLAEDKVTFTTRNEFGFSDLERQVPQATHHPFQLNADGSFVLSSTGNRVLEADRILDNPFPAGTYRNQLETHLTDGRFFSNYASVGYRRGNTNFTTSFTHDENQGILPFLEGIRRNNVRINLDQGLGASASLAASVFYAQSKNDQGPGTTGTGTFFSLLQAPPDVDLVNPGEDDIPYSQVFPTTAYSGVGTARGNPLYTLRYEEHEQRRGRLFAAFTGRYQPLTWLNLDANYGTDRLNEITRRYQFPGFLSTDADPTEGLLNNSTETNVSSNTQLNATATGERWNTRSTTRLTFLYEDERNIGFNANASKLNAVGVPDLSVADPEQLSVNSFDQTIRTRNYYITQGLDIRDRYLFQGLLRRDESSLFGADKRAKTFYGVSGAYRLTEDFTIPGVSELKIRAARGTAGLRPNYIDRFEVYATGNGTFSKLQQGNPDLEPAIQTEDEFGINVSFLERFDLELVQANRKTRGAFLAVPISPAQNGGFTQQVRNAADVSGRTTELQLNARVLNRPNMSWMMTLTGDRTRQRIDRLDVAPFRVGTGGQGQAVFFYKEGEPLGLIYGRKLVRSLDQLQHTVGYTGNQADYVVNSDGLVVLKSSVGTPDERGIFFRDTNSVGGGYTTDFVIGDVNPDFSFGFSNNFRFGGVGVYLLVDGVQGGDIYNFTRQWMYQDLRHADVDQSGKPAAERKPLAYYETTLYNALNPSDWFVEDGSYTRLRELSLSYSFDEGMLSRLGLRQVSNAKIALIGRNLLTWTDYSGFDPEATSGDLNFRIDGFRYPNFRQLTGQIQIGF